MVLVSKFPMAVLSKYTNGEFDFFYSKDLKEEDGLEDELTLEIVSSSVFEKSIQALSDSQVELINLYSKKNNLERIAILYAHGDSEDGKWVYFNGEDSHSIQRWIGQKDGKYKLLILSSCNPEQEEITSKKSIILAPNESHNLIDFEVGNAQLELFLPGKGYLSTYEIEAEIEKLKE